MRFLHAHTRLCRKEEVLTQQTTWCLRSSGCFYRRYASSSNFTRPLNGEVNETQNKHNLHLIIQRLDKTQDRRISRQEFTSLSVRSTIEKVIHTYELFLLDCSNMLVRCAVQFTFFKKEVSKFCCSLCDTLYGLKRLLLRIHNLQYLFQLYCLDREGRTTEDDAGRSCRFQVEVACISDQTFWWDPGGKDLLHFEPSRLF